MNKQFSLLGATGDVGVSFLEYASRKPITLKVFVREHSSKKIPSNISKRSNIQIHEFKSIFDRNVLESVFDKVDGVFNFIGMVSLGFSPRVYPDVLLVNSMFPGILRKHNYRNVPIQYISTQRVENIVGNEVVCDWIRNTHLYLEELMTHSEFSNEYYVNKIQLYLDKNPIPENMNIYEISKFLGENLSGDRVQIFRTSSVYGPLSSTRRTIGRMIFSEIVGQERREREEIRDYIYNTDLNEVMYGSIESDTFVTEYCASGQSVSKSDIVGFITEELNNQKTNSKCFIDTNDSKKEVYNPSNLWFIKQLKKEPVSIREGIRNTVSFMRENISNNPTLQRLTNRYDQIKQQTSEQGLNPIKQREIQNNFFVKDKTSNLWVGNEAIWKPTGVVFGYPFPEDFVRKVEVLKKVVQKELSLEDSDMWSVEPDKKHTTVVSYSHFSEDGLNLRKIPQDQLSAVKDTAEKFSPISVDYNGLVITDSGAVLVKGFVDNEELFHLRKTLLETVDGITQKVQDTAHITLMYVMRPIPYERVEYVNRKYSQYSIGKIVFDSMKNSDGDIFEFGK